MKSLRAQLHIAAVIAGGWTILPPPCFAQTPPVPPGALPGQIERQFERPPAAPRPGEEIQIPAARPQAIPPGADAIRFRLASVSVEGVTVYRQEDLALLFESLIGKEVALSELFALAAQLTAKYRNDGYVLSQVVVPEQRVADGRVRLRAIEGFINDVRIEGEVAGNRALLDAYTSKIKSNRPLRVAELERYLLLMNDLPGVLAQAVLEPARDTEGGANMVITMRHRPIDAYLEVNNRGSRALGPWRLEGSITLNSPLRFYEQFRGFVATTFNNELRFGALGADVPLGTEGLRLAVDGSYSKANPEPVLSPGQFESESWSGVVRLNYPVIRSRSQNLYVRGLFTAFSGRTAFEDVSVTDDKTRALRFGLSYDLTDRYLGVNLVDLELAQGLDIWGAKKGGELAPDRPGKLNFTKLNLYAARLQSVAARWSVLFAVSGQYAFDPLLISEQYAFGGAVFGRAYDAAELIGDSGIAGKVELRYGSISLGNVVRGISPYVFYEVGKVWRRQASQVASNLPESASGTDAGGGVRFNVLRNLSGYIELTKPLTRDVLLEGDRDWRVFGGVRWTF